MGMQMATETRALSGMPARVQLPGRLRRVAGLALAGCLGLLAMAALLRFAVAAALCTSVLHDEAADLDLWLLPLRDVVALLVWITSFAGNTVVWRGERFRISEGKLQKLGSGTHHN